MRVLATKYIAEWNLEVRWRHDGGGILNVGETRKKSSEKKRETYATRKENVWQHDINHLLTALLRFFGQYFCTTFVRRTKTERGKLTGSAGHPNQPKSEGIGRILGWPAVVLPPGLVDSRSDKPVDEISQAGTVEVTPIFAVVLGKHDERGEQNVQNVGVVDVAGAETLQVDAILLQLARKVLVPRGPWAKATPCGSDVEF
jgi:hypothetical protein